MPFEVGRPAGLKPGTPLDFPVAMNSGPLLLEPGIYEWRLTIDGEVDDDWRLPFSVRFEEDEVIAEVRRDVAATIARRAGSALLLAARRDVRRRSHRRAAGAEPDALEQLVGMRLVVGMNGTTPSPALLERIRTGRVGGVILMGAQHPLGAAGACADRRACAPLHVRAAVGS